MGSDRVQAYRKSSSIITPGFKPKQFSFLQPRYQDQVEAETDSFTEDKQQNSSEQSNPTPSSLSHSFGRMSVLPIQTKLAIGQPGDKYEQEANRVAAQVVQQINSPQAQQSGDIQRDTVNPEEGKSLQTKPVISTLQRETMPEEEEEEKRLQGKPLLQLREIPEEEEELQMKPLVQRQLESGAGSADLESSIESARGQGQPLENEMRDSMEQAFGADFSSVRVHTDTQSDQLNQSIQARAFTTGQDIFFRQGEYQPGNRNGQELLVHELTHVVQQNPHPLKQPSSSHFTEPAVQRVVDPISAASLGVAVFGLVSGFVQAGLGDLKWKRNIGKAIHAWPEGERPGPEEWERDLSTNILYLNMISGLSSSWAMFDLMWNYNGADIDQAHVTKYASSDWTFSAGDITFEMQDASASYEEGGKAAMICYISGSLDPVGSGDIDFEGRVLLFSDGTTRRLGDIRITRGDENDFEIDTYQGGWRITKR